jgi:hypothetical protein
MADSLDNFAPAISTLIRVNNMDRLHRRKLQHEEELHQQRLKHTREEEQIFGQRLQLLRDEIAELERRKGELREALAPVSRKRSTPQSHREPSEREIAIITAIQRRLKGVDYCKYLDDGKLPPPWPGAPKTHLAAYRQERWKKKIQHEKWRVKTIHSHLLSRWSENLQP